MGTSYANLIDPQLIEANVGSDYAYANVTVSGTNNALLTLGFSLDDGSSVYVANLTNPSIVNTVPFDLTNYSDRILRGDFFVSVMSANGTQASVDITEKFVAYPDE